MLADYHIHTSFSPDSTYKMKNCILKAISLGFDEICFTEHIDYGCLNSFCCNCEEYYKSFLYYQNFYKNKIKLKFGMEFGVQAHHKNYFQNIFDSYPFDFIIMSFHQVQDKELWNQEFQNGKTQKEYYELYYNEVLKSVNTYGDFSVLGHLDLLQRYEIYGDYPFESIKPKIEEIFDYIISKGKGIEVNTSSFRYNLRDLTPSTDILKLYKKMGGKILTIGSDSHNENQLGAYIPYIREKLKSLGYKYFTTFDKMQPVFYEL